jgi:polar amino acid transport system substrate-binding protein
MRLQAAALLPILVFAPVRTMAAPLTIMAEDASEPYSRHDGTGYANDIVRAAFKAAGVEVRLDVVPYARCKKSVEDGATPACVAMSWLPEFQGRIRFSDRPLFEVHADVFQNRRAKRLSGPGDLGPGATLGVINGYEYPGEIYRLARRGVVLEGNASEASNLQMLAKGRLDAAVMMTGEFSNMPGRLAWFHVDRSVMFAFRSGLMRSYIGFSVANPKGEEARRAFNRGYAMILANHEKDKIRDSWMAGSATP